MKTVNHWLLELPEGARERAFTNLGNVPAYTVGQALRLAFNWASSPEGFEYWEKVCKEIEPERECVGDWVDMFHPHMLAEYSKLARSVDPDRLLDTLGIRADTFYEAITCIWSRLARNTPYRHIWFEFREKCGSTQYCVDKASDIPIPGIREEVLRRMTHQAALCGSYNSAILNGGMNPSHYDLVNISQEIFDLLDHYDAEFVTKENINTHVERSKERVREQAKREQLSSSTDLPF